MLQKVNKLTAEMGLEQQKVSQTRLAAGYLLLINDACTPYFWLTLEMRLALKLAKSKD